MSELAPLPRDTRGVTLLSDCSHEIRACTLDGEGAGANFFACVLRDRLRLAGEDRLVERESITAPERSVGDDLVACVKEYDVALDNVFDIDFPWLAVPQHARGRRDKCCEVVERSLCANL